MFRTTITIPCFFLAFAYLLGYLCGYSEGRSHLRNPMLITHKYQPKKRDIDKPTGYIKRWLRKKLRRFVGRVESNTRTQA